MNGADEGYLFSRVHKDSILMVRYDAGLNIITSSLDLSICIINKQGQKTFIEDIDSPVISYAQSSDGQHIFTGSQDMVVTVWFKTWTKLCLLNSTVNVDRLYIS